MTELRGWGARPPSEPGRFDRNQSLMTVQTPIAGKAPSTHPVRGPARWRPPGGQIIAALAVLLGAVILMYPHAASWFSQREQSRVTDIAMQRLTEPPNTEPGVLADQLADAERYNALLASGARLEAGGRVPVGVSESPGEALDYRLLLDATGTGFMGRLQYPELTIDLPIYHGTADSTLLKGIGHLEGTSLPVGGAGTRSVLTAHRGLPTATLFNDLDRSAVGDMITVSVLDRVLSYRVIDTRVILPEDTESIVATPGEDLLTLVTCTPLGINSHRILVTAERVAPTPDEELAAALKRPDLPGFPWWAVALTSVGAAGALYLWRTGRVSAG